jgi:hypothetical protein
MTWHSLSKTPRLSSKPFMFDVLRKALRLLFDAETFTVEE